MINGICACGRKWWWTDHLVNCPPCGQCGREHTADDLRRARQEAKKAKELARKNYRGPQAKRS